MMKNSQECGNNFNKKLLREFIKKVLDEIDWGGEFSDVQKTCINQGWLVEYLNDILKNRELSYQKRKKFDKTLPFIHTYSKHLISGEEGINVDAFIESITSPPLSIIGKNAKLSHTGGKNEYAYNTGIPAFRGLVFDEENKKFYIINTCPGAGTCINICYALKGNYIMYSASYDSMIRRINYLLNHPEKYQEQLLNELRDVCKKHKAYIGGNNIVFIRWNDSGDFFSKKYVKIAHDVMEILMDEGFSIKGAAHTKIADVALGGDIYTSFSTDASKKEREKIKKAGGTKTSTTVPRDIFSDLEIDTKEGMEQLKDRISSEYDFDRSKLLSYKEMMNKSDEGSGYGAVIIPGDGDDALFRKDISKIFHTRH